MRQSCTPRGTVAVAQTSAEASAALWAGAHAAAVPPTAVVAQTGVDASAAGLTKIATFISGVTLSPWIGTIVTMGSRPLSGTSVPAAGGYPHQDQLRRVGHGDEGTLQVQHMWEAIQYGDIDYYEDR
jgi:hypothetical protein